MNLQENKGCYIVNEKGIYGFFEQNRWLSNFHLCSVDYLKYTFSSSENAFQAAKCANPKDITKFLNITPSASKALGRKIELRKDWDEVKTHIMYDIVMAKFQNNSVLRNKLLETGELHLEEANWWNDKFWGVCRGEGANNLGKILMQVRTTLKNS